VRVHPETGRKALYLNELLTREICGMTRQESAGLLDFLFAHSVKAEFVYRHVWRVNDVVMWDNRCGMHLAPADYDPDALRDMCRVTLAGERIGRLFDSGRQPAA
jgi:taurine dioxygenase